MNPLILDTILYATQIIIFQLIATPIFSLLVYKQGLLKNKSWVKENPDFLKKYPAPLTLHSYIIGAFLLISIGYCYFTNNTAFMRTVHFASAFVFLVQHLVYDLLRDKKIRSEIPASPIRKASITPRQLNDYIPKWFIILSSSLFALFLLGCVYFFFSNTGDLQTLMKLVGAPVIISLTCFGCLIYSLKRKPVTPNSEMALTYRTLKIQALFFICSSFLVLCLLKFAGHYFGIAFLEDSPKLMGRVFTLICMGIFIWFVLNSGIKKLYTEKF